MKKRYKLVERGNGMYELKRDIRHGLVYGSLIAPFPLLGLFGAPFWAWLIYLGWGFLVTFVNFPDVVKKRKKKFQTFKLDKDFVKGVDLDETA